ncbi:MAG: Cj0069 family protein [Candidatus Thorarchaeota archaeon]
MEKKVGLILLGDRKSQETLTPQNSRLHILFAELSKNHINSELIIYSDDFVDEVKAQCETFDILLVWVNPIDHDHDRSVLDNMLRSLSAKGIFVSSHPDIILKMGTKEIIHRTKDMEWGSDVYIYKRLREFQEQFSSRLKACGSRVLKQNRGNGGNGVWRVEYSKSLRNSNNDFYVKVFHALRNSLEQEILFSEFIETIKFYFDNSGLIIDQEFISPEPLGMIRCYLTHNKVVGFGHQHVTALVRPEKSGEILEPPPRLYYSKDKEEYQDLRVKMEEKWVPELQEKLKIKTLELPVIWDADFLYRVDKNKEKSNYVLCEINVSSVFPFPDYAISDIISSIKNIFKIN